MSKKVGDYFHYSGAVHIHTTESDGTKSLEEVIQIGRDSGLDFMMFSDHMTLSLRDNGGEGLYGKTLVVIGYEHNDEADEHHYLLYESPNVYSEKMSVKEYVVAGAEDNAIGILAHPDEIRNHLVEYPPYPWRDWDAHQFNGIEIWNQMSEWMEKLTRFNKLAMSLSPRKSMEGPTDRILKKWDELNETKKVFGVAGVDAHAFPVNITPFYRIEIFPYKVHFKCLRTHVIFHEPMSDDFNVAKKQFYNALRECNVYFSNIRWGSADNFMFTAENNNEKIVCGEELSKYENGFISVKLPGKATIRLVHNGNYILETKSDSLTYKNIQPGLYRVEAWKGRRGWIFSNHIRVAG